MCVFVSNIHAWLHTVGLCVDVQYVYLSSWYMHLLVCPCAYCMHDCYMSFEFHIFLGQYGGVCVGAPVLCR